VIIIICKFNTEVLSRIYSSVSTGGIEVKKISIRFETLEKICKVLKCTPNDIIEFDFEE